MKSKQNDRTIDFLFQSDDRGALNIIQDFHITPTYYRIYYLVLFI